MTDSDASSSRFYEELQSTIERLSGEGWAVEVEPKVVPQALGKFRPDFIARRGDEIIIGEVKFRGEKELASLEQLSRAVDQIPHARLEMVWLGRADEPPAVGDVLKMSSSATDLIPTTAPAAMLLAWAALEGAMAVYSEAFASKRAYLRQRTGLRQKLSEMASLGDLSESQFSRLYVAMKDRNSIAHGMYVEPREDLIRYVATIAGALARGSFATIEDMVEWFLGNYEDPAHKVPFRSADGGYQYFAGGPFFAEDVLTERFDAMPQVDISTAVLEIESESIEWVRRGDY